MATKLLDQIKGPDDVKKIPLEELPRLAKEIREELIEVLSKTGGHLGPNLGVVELTIALHRVFDAQAFDRPARSVPHDSAAGRAEWIHVEDGERSRLFWGGARWNGSFGGVGHGIGPRYAGRQGACGLFGRRCRFYLRGDF